MVRSVPNKNADDDKYEQRQKRYWEQLRQEFNRFKSELGVTNSELAQCLGISRQPLVSFMQNSSFGLPIQRSNLERLWDLLTDPERLKEKRLSSGAKLKREDLRRKGADTLLKAAGFLPNSEDQILDVSPSRHQQLQRVVSRLSSLPIEEPADFIRLIESIENFIARSLPPQRRFELDKNQLPNLSVSSEEIVERWIRDNNFAHTTESYIENKFRVAVSNLAVSGKYELESSEMFELYMAICENERLHRDVNEYLKIRITQCQFKTLTFLFTEYKINERLEKELNQASLEAEKQLRVALNNIQYKENYLEDAVSDVVIEALIVCNFRKTKENISWRYSSSTTHLENMFAAISYSMGCESELELVDLSIRSLGRKDYSLVKTSSVFGNINTCGNEQNSKIYQGTWVDRSTILGLLQSVSIAIRSWLSEIFTNTEQCEGYYKVCKEVAAIDNSLMKGRKVLNDYRIQQNEYSNGFSANRFLEKEVINKIQELREGLLRENPTLQKLYGATLDYKYCIAELSCAHSALIEGDIVKAKKLLTNIEAYLNKIDYQDTPLKILFLSEKMLQLFFIGDQEFLSKSSGWRSDLEMSLKELSEYIYKFRKYCGRFDYDTYMVASEIFGRVGRLNFCLCKLGDVEYLEQATQNFLKAAYCSSKIGHRQRAARWISNASRVCSRLDYGDCAEEFSNLAETIIEHSLEPAYSLEHQEGVMAEVNLSHGERLLLIEENFSEALKYFLKSLRGSIYIGFPRLIADNLYNIARASKDLEDCKVRKSFEDAFGRRNSENQHNWKLEENKQAWKNNKIVLEVIKFINQIDSDSDWNSVSRKFQQESKKIWHTWANSGNSNGRIRHLIEDEIDNYRYLSRVK